MSISHWSNFFDSHKKLAFGSSFRHIEDTFLWDVAYRIDSIRMSQEGKNYGKRFSMVEPCLRLLHRHSLPTSHPNTKNLPLCMAERCDGKAPSCKHGLKEHPTAMKNLLVEEDLWSTNDVFFLTPCSSPFFSQTSEQKPCANRESRGGQNRMQRGRFCPKT